MIGEVFGPYRVLDKLGEGGMGEVYRAHDATLGRDVALKILPPGVAHDPDRIARFRREAQILARLNHPLIASIYGVEESRVPALVLELVEGPTLAERIRAGAIPLDEALRIAHQIGQALEAAHEQGIIHRDLKPANIKLRPDGAVKILDFGLARALDPSSQTPAPDSAATISSPAITRLGVILGTAAYMSPEQACGQTVDRGADIWAFGAVLFEMLTASRAFEGDDPTQAIASVLRSDPDWTRLPPATPESIRRVLRRCLEKDRRRRLGDIRDACLDIEEAQQATEPVVRGARAIGQRERVMWIAMVGAVAALGIGWSISRPAPPAPAREAHVEITTPATPDPAALALSPDGKKLAFVAFADGRTQLWVRMLESGAVGPLRGTDGAAFPFWSPDSRSLGFFAAERIRRVDLSGSAPVVIGRAVIGPGGTWNRDGVILFPMVPDSPLFRIPAEGGEPLPLSQPKAGEPGQRYPQFLPDGRHFLYFVAESRAVFLGSIDGSAPRKLFNADAPAVFAPPAEVLFVRGGVLNAQKFDPVRQQPEGEPIPLASGVAVHAFGGAAVSASADGSIAYRTGSGAQERQFVWLNRSGAPVGVVGKPDQAGPTNLSLSPDERQVVFSRTVDGNTDLWITDAERGILTPFTRGPSPDICPVWQPDGLSVLFSAADRGVFVLSVKSTITDTDAVLLGGGPALRGIAMDQSRDGRYVLYRIAESGQWDIWAAPTKAGAAPFPVTQSPADERTAQFSPDTRWIAYESNESGQYEIYVRPFPGPGTGKAVSTNGGAQPRWRRNGSELFYIAPDSRLMSVPMEFPSRDTIRPGTAVALFPARVTSTVHGGTAFEYDVSADGQRFLVNTMVERPTAPISLILNRRR